MGYNHRQEKIKALRNSTLQVYMGSLFKILETKFGVNMQSMYTNWNSGDLVEILFQVYEKDQETLLRYFDMKRFLTTAMIQAEDQGQSCCHEQDWCSHVYSAMDPSEFSEDA